MDDRATCGERTWTYYALSLSIAPAPNLCMFTSLEALGTSYYWDFYGGFIMKA